MVTWGRGRPGLELATASPASPSPGNRELNKSSASLPDRDIWGWDWTAGGLSVTTGGGGGDDDEGMGAGDFLTLGAFALVTVSPAFRKPAG